jgi:hypothetical protein
LIDPSADEQLFCVEKKQAFQFELGTNNPSRDEAGLPLLPFSFAASASPFSIARLPTA